MKVGNPSIYDEKTIQQRSGLSNVLILMSLGALLMSVTLGLVSIHPVWKSFYALLFVVFLVVVEVWLTDRFDESVQYLNNYSKHLHRNRLEHEDWRSKDSRQII